MIKAIIFDWGGVLIDEPLIDMLTYYAKELGFEFDPFKEIFESYDHALGRGELTPEEFFNIVFEKLNMPKKDTTDLWYKGLKNAYKRKPEMFGLIDNLKKNGYTLGFLSNTQTACVKMFEEDGLEELFEHIVFSCDELCRKPDKEIYEITLKKIGLPAEECVFIDDRQENIDACKAIGMQGILFETPEQVIADLVKLGVKVE